MSTMIKKKHYVDRKRKLYYYYYYYYYLLTGGYKARIAPSYRQFNASKRQGIGVIAEKRGRMRCDMTVQETLA